MFEVFVSTHPMQPNHPRGYAASKEANPMAGISGTVNFDKTAVFAHLNGQVIVCTTGHLWVTIENDREDHVLFPGQRLLVSTPGKVIIGGRGGYSL